MKLIFNGQPTDPGPQNNTEFVANLRRSTDERCERREMSYRTEVDVDKIEMIIVEEVVVGGKTIFIIINCNRLLLNTNCLIVLPFLRVRRDDSHAIFYLEVDAS